MNDSAERAIALMQQYNMSLTKNEDQKQFLLQIVNHHRKTYRSCSKATLIKVVMEDGRTVGDKILIDAPYSPDIIKEVPNGRFPPVLRRKRQAACGSTVATVTESQKTEVVDWHNHWRGQEQAKNELIMTWDEELASLAQEWANTCQWSHGMLTGCDGATIGQNLFMKSGSDDYPSANFTNAIESWNSERNYWDFNKQACQTGKVCGHWSQLVGARSGKVGCAFAQCPSVAVSGGTWSKVIIIVCNYSPAGNVLGQAIFLPGAPCTACTTVTGSLTYRGYKCRDNLCVPCIPKNDRTCQCGPDLICQNGGSYSSDTCVCQCPSGFYGAQCESSCSCGDLYGSTCLGWTQFCADPLYTTFMTTNCAKTCNLCNIPASCLA